MKYRELHGEELRVLLDHCAAGRPRVVRGPILPARNPEPLRDRGAEQWRPDCEAREARRWSDRLCVEVGALAGLAIAALTWLWLR